MSVEQKRTALKFGDPESIRQRDIAALNSEAVYRAHSIPENLPGMIAEAKRLLADNSNPWRVNTIKSLGDDWLLASFGNDQNNVQWILTTDHVRASEYEGDAESDARFCALARRLIPALIDEREL